MLKPFVRGRVATLVALLLALAGVVTLWREGGEAKSPGLDFYQFWVGGQIAGRRDIANLYDAAAGRRIGIEYLERARFEDPTPRRLDLAQARRDLELFSTPFLYTCFSLFPGKHYDADYDIFRVLSLAAGVGSIVAISWLLGFSAAQALLVVAFATLLFEPMRSDVRVANVNQLQLAMLAGFLVLLARRAAWSAALAGVVLGAALAFKPNIVAIVPLVAVVLWQRRRRELIEGAAGLTAGLAIAVVASALRFGNLHCWSDWLGAASALSKVTLSLAFGNVAPALPLIDRFGPGVTWLCGGILLTMAIVAMLRAGFDGEDDFATVAAVGFGLLVYLLGARLVWLHYLVLALPLGFVLLRPASDREAGRVWIRQLAGFVALTAVAANPWKPLLHVETIEGETVLLWLGLIGLYGTAIWWLSKPSRIQRAR